MIETLVNIDETIFQWINSDLSNTVFDAILVPFRHKMFWIPLYLFLILFISVNFNREKWLIFAMIGLTVLISDTSSSKIIKNNVERIRPCHVVELNPVSRVPCSQGYSFTSSHATNHFAIGLFFFGLFSFTKWKWLFIAWAGIIAFSQVYVGVHYPFDVLAGGILGILIGIMTLRLYRFLNKKIFITENG
ncbi:MAG: phosphatase PAP2 family protein [Bacteroidia bacterium]|nr:phosphatase PAP2 family protein [Bacteroidia bacterium]MBT8230570.1 phosphatase PAP2 family protein [Bacteroidia bacterium]